MFGITENFKEKQRVKQNLEEIEKNQQDAFADLILHAVIMRNVWKIKTLQKKLCMNPEEGKNSFRFAALCLKRLPNGWILQTIRIF